MVRPDHSLVANNKLGVGIIVAIPANNIPQHRRYLYDCRFPATTHFIVVSLFNARKSSVQTDKLGALAMQVKASKLN